MVNDVAVVEHAHEAGSNAASWVDYDQILTILKGSHDGDPEVLDAQPNPLSGEWGGDFSMADLATLAGCDEGTEDHTAMADLYEMEFQSAYEEALYVRLDEDDLAAYREFCEEAHG